MAERPRDPRAESPPDDPDGFDALVDYLLSEVRVTLKRPLDGRTQHELGFLLAFLRERNLQFVSNNKVLFKVAFDQLATDKPNLDLVRQIRLSIQVARVRERGGFTGLIVKFCGPGPVTAVMAGLLTTFVALCLVLFLITYVSLELHRYNDTTGEFDRLRLLTEHVKLGDLYLLFVASFFGSIVSIATRIGTFVAYTLHDPLEIFTSVLFRPFVAFSFAVFVYAVLRSGIVSFLGVDLDGRTGTAVLWIFGFLAGYSERFSKEFVSSTEGKLTPAAPEEKSS